MIFKHSKLEIADNSGAGVIKCIQVVSKGKNLNPTHNCSFIKASVKRLRKSIPKKRVEKGEVVNALVIQDSTYNRRFNSLIFKCKRNAAILLSKDNDSLLSNRIVRPVFLEVRKTGLTRIITLSPGVI